MKRIFKKFLLIVVLVVWTPIHWMNKLDDWLDENFGKNQDE